MNELELVEKAAKKLADIEKQQSVLLENMSKKASQEEVDALRSTLESVTTSIARLNTAIEEHASAIENLQVTQPADIAVEASKHIAKLKDLRNKRGRIILDNSLVGIRNVVRKSINAPYISSVSTMQDITYLNQRMIPSLVDIFLREDAPTPSMIFLSLDITATGGGTSNVQGCFLPTETDGDLTTVTINATTFRGWTQVCDTHLEDYPQFLDAIYDIMSQIIGNRIDASIVSSLLVNSTLNTIYPSYTTLAGQVVDANFYDVVAIHMMDVVSTTNGKYVPNYVLLNPIDVARYVTSKITSSYVTQLDVAGIQFPRIFISTQVPSNTFYLLDSNAVGYYPVRGTEIEIATQDTDNFRRGIQTIRASERGIIGATNLSAFGVVRGQIDTTIANFRTP